MSQLFQPVPYQQLGPNMAALPDVFIFNFNLNRNLFSTVQSLLKSAFIPFTEYALYHLIVQQIYVPTEVTLRELIYEIVPSDSGRTRNDLELSIRYAGSVSWSGNLNHLAMIMSIKGVKYSPYANAMISTWLQHPGMHGRTLSKRRGRTTKPRKAKWHVLHDPNAQQFWYQSLAEEGGNKAESLYEDLVLGRSGSIENRSLPQLFSTQIPNPFSPKTKLPLYQHPLVLGLQPSITSPDVLADLLLGGFFYGN